MLVTQSIGHSKCQSDAYHISVVVTRGTMHSMCSPCGHLGGCPFGLACIQEFGQQHRIVSSTCPCGTELQYWLTHAVDSLLRFLPAVLVPFIALFFGVYPLVLNRDFALAATLYFTASSFVTSVSAAAVGMVCCRAAVSAVYRMAYQCEMLSGGLFQCVPSQGPIAAPLPPQKNFCQFQPHHTDQPVIV
jgi:hypothetical protein